MEIVDIISFVEKYLSEYARVFLKTLAHPIAQFRPLGATATKDIPVKSHNTTVISGAVSRPELLVFILISIFLGSTINSFVPARKYSGDIIGQVVVISFCWLFFAVFTHTLCRIFRGKAEFQQTLWVSLQVFAMLFVVSSFVNLVGGVFVRHPQVSSLLVSAGRLGDSIANNPVYIYFIAQFALLNIYLPLAIKELHGFGWVKPIVIGITLALFWVIFGIAFSSDIGVMYRKI